MSRYKLTLCRITTGAVMMMAATCFSCKKKEEAPLQQTPSSAHAATDFRSVFTPLTGDKCRLEDSSDEGGYSLLSCPGVNGFHLLIEEFDARTTVTIVDPQKKDHPLQFGQFVTEHFSWLDEKAEWRTKKVGKSEKPVALIVRVYSQNPEDSGRYKIFSYLVVAKITLQDTCVTDIIPPGPDQNEKASQAADKALTTPCIEEIH